MAHRVGLVLFGCLCWAAVGCSKHPMPAPDTSIGELQNTLLRATVGSYLSRHPSDESAVIPNARQLPSVHTMSAADGLPSVPATSSESSSGTVPAPVSATATGEPTGENPSANVAPESGFDAKSLPEPAPSSVQASAPVTTADDGSEAASASTNSPEEALDDTSRSGAETNEPSRSVASENEEPQRQEPDVTANDPVPPVGKVEAVTTQPTASTELAMTYGAGPGFTGVSAGTSGYTGVGAGPGSTGVSAGPGSTGVGAGPGSTDVGAGSGYTGVGAGSGSTGVGAGAGHTGIGAGSGYTGIGASTNQASTLSGADSASCGGWGVVMWQTPWGPVLMPVAVQ